MARLLICLLLLTSVVDARPLSSREGKRHRAVHKGQTQIMVADDDFPTNFLDWVYQRPELIKWHINYKNWEKEYRKYFKSHYNERSLTFKPSMIVMHFTVVPTAEATHALFQRNHVSVQLMIGKDGSIYELMPLNRRCTGAYGVNHKALSIEMVARSEQDLLSRQFQVFQSFCLVKYLMAKYDIPLSKVVGHYEVGEGVTRVPEYLDLHDKYSPTRYPASSKRTDPGKTYMRWLRSYLEMNPPTTGDL